MFHVAPIQQFAVLALLVIHEVLISSTFPVYWVLSISNKFGRLSFGRVAFLKTVVAPARFLNYSSTFSMEWDRSSLYERTKFLIG